MQSNINHHLFKKKSFARANDIKVQNSFCDRTLNYPRGVLFKEVRQDLTSYNK